MHAYHPYTRTIFYTHTLTLSHKHTLSLTHTLTHTHARAGDIMVGLTAAPFIFYSDEIDEVNGTRVSVYMFICVYIYTHYLALNPPTLVPNQNTLTHFYIHTLSHNSTYTLALTYSLIYDCTHTHTLTQAGQSVRPWTMRLRARVHILLAPPAT
jgi:hypothetical protein